MKRPAAFDVAVVGGGPAGIAAGLCAAQAGARTLLLESSSRLGGNVSQAFVHTFCGLFRSDEEKPVPVNPGFPMHFYEALRRGGAARAPERAGRVWVSAIEPLAVGDLAEQRCEAEPNLEWWPASPVSQATLAEQPGGESCLRVQRSGAGGRASDVTAAVVIDTSGAGALGPLGGCEYDLAPSERLQASSFIFRLSGVPPESLAGFERMKLSVALAQASQAGRLPGGCESILLRPAGETGGEAFVTLNLPPLDGRAYDPLDDDYCARMASRGRAFARSIAQHLRRERPGFEACEVSGWPARLGVREGRRLVGLEMLSEPEVMEGRRSAAEVALSSWPIELWDDHRRAQMRYPEGPSSIPLGCLVSRSHPRLGMAGRCVSASHEALGAVRVIGTALATGAAVGRAAALAAGRGVGLADIDPREARVAALGEAP